MSMNRREFFAYSAAATLLATTVKAVAEETGFRIGCQSYSFRAFDYKEAIAKLKELELTDMEFCNVHFPPNAEDEKFLEAHAYIKEAGVNTPCYGVEGYGPNEGPNRQRFEFGKALGVEVLTAHPSPNSFDHLEELVQEFDIKIGIHNHGPRHAYDKVEDTLKAVEGRHPYIGACVDTGHAIRSAEKPHEVIRALGERVHSLHLKDWIHGGEEQTLGEGDMDLVEVVRALRELNFDGPLMIEYELHPDNPVPGMIQGLENFRKACADA
jgi:inosose dehydratase